MRCGAQGPLSLKVRVAKPGIQSVHEAVIDRVIPGEVSLFLDHRFPLDTVLRVDINGFHFDGTVAYCAARDGAFETHIVMLDTDATGKRRDPRYVIDLPALLHTQSSEEPVRVRLVDISRQGFGLESPLKLRTGEYVVVESQSNLAFGTVRHCREVSNTNFRAGVLVENVINRETDSGARLQKRYWLTSLLSPRS